ncbi:unnamed protein product [Sphenostylis stenocarpa]|uniref:Uncharacterized protein n=1 Tax=Sphenostylis stenocarpa TaxID=92480 RepID=A0AA86SQT7_9FABA|nr:unnamed protein product [Sphenostylis stenocarpa]
MVKLRKSQTRIGIWKASYPAVDRTATASEEVKLNEEHFAKFRKTLEVTLNKLLDNYEEGFRKAIR